MGNTLLQVTKLGDTVIALFGGDGVAAIVSVDVSYSGPKGTVLFNGTDPPIDNVVLAPAPNGAGFVPYSFFFCEDNSLCVAHLDPDILALSLWGFHSQ